MNNTTKIIINFVTFYSFQVENRNLKRQIASLSKAGKDKPAATSG